MSSWPRYSYQKLEAERRARRFTSISLSIAAILIWPILLMFEIGLVETIVCSLLLSILAELVEINGSLKR